MQRSGAGEAERRKGGIASTVWAQDMQKVVVADAAGGQEEAVLAAR
jgi:hypothetical protein